MAATIALRPCLRRAVSPSLSRVWCNAPASDQFPSHATGRANAGVLPVLACLELAGSRAGDESLPARGADLRSALLLVFERELQLGAVGERPALIQRDVLLNDLSHPQIAEGPGGRPDRLRRRIFP